MCDKEEELLSLFKRRKILCKELRSLREVAYEFIHTSGASYKVTLANAILFDTLEYSLRWAIVFVDETIIDVLTSGEGR